MKACLAPSTPEENTLDAKQELKLTAAISLLPKEDVVRHYGLTSVRLVQFIVDASRFVLLKDKENI